VRFPYIPFAVAATPAHPGSTVAHRPYVPFRVVDPRGSTRLDGLLDTGADEIILPRSIAEPLGIALDDNAHGRFRGVGGHVVIVVYGSVEIEVATTSQELRWSATVAFLDDGPGAILGRTGFLEFFTATFNGNQRHVTLTPNTAFPTRTAT
jgi:predicted aspartyl protease